MTETEQILEAYRSCLGIPAPSLYFKVEEDNRWLLGESQYPVDPPTKPADWFAHHFPKQAKEYGPAMLERRIPTKDGIERVVPLNLNEDFAASMLASPKCGQFIFYRPEERFYRFDAKDDCFTVATEEDLKLALSQQLVKCAQQMNSYVNLHPLLGDFRSEECLNRIIRRAKSVIAKDQEFFAHGSENRRSALLVPEEAARRFVDECMEENNDSYITVKECQHQYHQFALANNYPIISRIGFTEIMNAQIRRKFNRSFRSDLLKYGADQARGWKGVTFKASDE